MSDRSVTTQQFDELEPLNYLEAACGQADEVFACLQQGEKFDGQIQLALDQFNRVYDAHLTRTQREELIERIGRAILKLDPSIQWEAARLFKIPVYLIVIKNATPDEEGGDERAP